MLINEVDFKHNSIEEINEKILEIKMSDKPLIIRNGLEFKDLDGWHYYLKNDLALKDDRRHFGFDESLVHADWWEISFQPEKATSYAYSNTRQPLHNDNAWFAKPAEMNFFAMVKQASTGGEQTVYPVARLIKDLEDKDPELLKKLKTELVLIKKGDTEHGNHTTIIVDGENPKIFWNYYRIERTSDEINEICESFFKFLEMQETTDSVFRVRLNTGDCLAFNDSLVLHGREAFNVTESKGRIICQSMWNI